MDGGLPCAPRWHVMSTIDASWLRYVVLLPPAERRVRQVADRAGHGFTDEDATRHMHREFVRADILARPDAGTLRYS